MSAATAIINWKQLADNTKPLLIVKTEPDSIYTGDSFKVRLFSAYNHNLISPYGGLGSKQIEAAKPITETVELSGSSEIRTEYPIKSVSTIRALLPIIDETTRAIVIAAGDSARDLVSVVNQQLKLSNETLKLHGSVEVRYSTFDAQVWQHKPFNSKGRVLLFAHNVELGNYENVPITINERSKPGDSIKIEAWTFQPKQSFNPYHAVVIYPADKKYIVKADVGEVKFREPVTHTIKAESISFSGKEITTSYPLIRLKKVTGIFFDASLNEITPHFRLSDGMIKSDVECYGFAIVDYDTKGLIYDYNADVHIDTILHHTTINIGHIIAQEKGKTGIGASYKVPLWQTEVKKPVDFYTITRKVLAQSATTFEYPPNWSNDDNTYPNLPGASAIPELGSGFVTAVVVESGYVDSSGSIDYDTHSNAFYDPYAGSPTNPDAIYEIQTSIPSDIVDTSLITTLEEKISEAKERWGIA